MSVEAMSDVVAMTPDEVARAYLKSTIENKRAHLDKCEREVSAFMAADDVNLATFTRRWESARVEAAKALEVYETLRDIVANGDEYREQHENLLSVRQSDLTALTAKIDAFEARAIAAERERDELRAAQGWRTIDSAPDDELFIAAIEVNTVNGPVYWQMDIVYIDDETGDIALDCEACWRLQDYSHWQPLPAPPANHSAPVVEE